MPTIDLNADLGESFGRYRLPADAELLGLVSSANVACGVHAGDPLVMRETAALAARHGVTVGAHPGYPDLQGFGRRDMELAPEEISAFVTWQVGALAAFCRAAGAALRYVKPHGALYNRAARDARVADAVAAGVRDADPSLALLGLAGSELVAAAGRAGLRAAREAFIDRAYLPEGALVPRARADAVLHDVDAVVERAVRMVCEGRIAAVDGSTLDVRADSLCVHGDTPEAVALLRAVRARFAREGITVAPFAA